MDARELLDRLPVTQPASAEVLQVIGTYADRINGAMGSPTHGRLFTRLMLNTWQTTITRGSDGSAFVITGDIPAMWLRDSAAQMRPFIPLAVESVEIAACLEAIVAKQWEYIERAPYANAFNAGPTNASWHAGDLCSNPWVWEEKYEIDSLAFPVQLAWQLWRVSGRDEVLDPLRNRARIVVDLWRTEQDHAERSPYRFVRPGTSDTLARWGRGDPVARTGMTWSGFRPSDDPCTFGYNIPGNLFAVHALELVADMATEAWQDEELATEASSLADEIREGVMKHGIGPDRVLAYEVDGLGNQLMTDDANMPSLLSLPLTSSISRHDPLYRSARRFVLSQANPQYFLGTHASGVGSPHSPEGWVWPIALAVQGLTCRTDDKFRLLATLARTDGGTGMMHESFNPHDPQEFTRPWFSWANSMYCELALATADVTLDDVTGRWQ